MRKKKRMKQNMMGNPRIQVVATRLKRNETSLESFQTTNESVPFSHMTIFDWLEIKKKKVKKLPYAVASEIFPPGNPHFSKPAPNFFFLFSLKVF